MSSGKGESGFRVKRWSKPMPGGCRGSQEMGCNSSSVVPLGETDIGGAGIKVRVNPSTPDTVKLSPNHDGSKNSFRKKPNAPPLVSSEPPVETLTKDFNAAGDSRGVPPPPPPPPPPMAFEVPVNEESLIRKHPPRRFRRLEEQQTDNARVLTHESIDVKQQEAESRRREILTQRIQSAQQKNLGNRRLTRADPYVQQSEEAVDWEKNV